MANRIQLRRDTSTNWAAVNPILTQGELGLELNTGKLKVGNGITAWNSLPYFSLSYSDLTGAPVNVSDLINDVGYITAADLPANELPVNAAGYLKNNGSGVLTWETVTIPTAVSQLTNDSGYITAADVPASFSGDYNDLTNTPTIPTATSQLTNDSGYITAADVSTGTLGFIDNAIVSVQLETPGFDNGLIRLAPGSGTEGAPYFSAGQYIDIYPTNNFDAPHIHVAAGTGGDLILGTDTFNVSVNNGGNIKINPITSSGWEFRQDNSIVFPDTTVQTTGYQKVAVPTTSLGQLGDQVGMVAHDANYHYYCKANYVAPTIYTYIGMEALPPEVNTFGWTNQFYGTSTYWIPYFTTYNTSNPVPQVGWEVVINGATLTITGVTPNPGVAGMTYLLNFAAPITNGPDMSYQADQGSGNIWVRTAWSADTW